MVKSPVHVFGMGNNVYTLRINNKSCSCEKWQTYTLPCSHVLAVCRENRSGTDTYVPEIYSRQTYRRTYQANFHPVLSENFLRDVPFSLTFYPPNMKRNELLVFEEFNFHILTSARAVQYFLKNALSLPIVVNLCSKPLPINANHAHHFVDEMVPFAVLSHLDEVAQPTITVEEEIAAISNDSCVEMTLIFDKYNVNLLMEYYGNLSGEIEDPKSPCFRVVYLDNSGHVVVSWSLIISDLDRNFVSMLETTSSISSSPLIASTSSIFVNGRGEVLLVDASEAGVVEVDELDLLVMPKVLPSGAMLPSATQTAPAPAAPARTRRQQSSRRTQPSIRSTSTSPAPEASTRNPSPPFPHIELLEAISRLDQIENVVTT
ncbi:hypothetical protein M9H77_02555 [Catharanthus roseus]|uniref:Uncharacterized protein n=1 Tax=Catharanthus roseus TaxID=4058 RepID=A0ACC0C980_CATRO|nr:hypothetical protein M9H77_02555 [Catharanthus roseus]